MTNGNRSWCVTAALALSVTTAGTAARAACSPAEAGNTIAIPMHKAADHAQTDPAGIWTKWDMWNPSTPAFTTIWSGSASSCGGEVIVSQIVNRQCSSASECPARVVLRQGHLQRVLLNYRQVCTVHQTFQIQADLSSLEACGQSFPLRPAGD